MKPRLLVVRTDRLGDVLLSLPALIALKLALGSRFDVDFLVSSSLVELLTPFLKQQGIEPIAFGPSTSWQQSLRSRSYAASVCFFFDAPVARFLKQLRIPIRVGPYSKWGSLWSFNRGLWQRRSRAEKSETQYAVELAELLCKELGGASFSLSNEVLPPNPKVWERVQSRLGLKSSYGVVHPGMGGSAENLSLKGYEHLVPLFSNSVDEVLLSVGPAEADRAFDGLLNLPKVRKVEGLSLVEFSELLRHAKWMLAPSTGPLHLAHWVGTEVFGIFATVRTQLARRWAPRGGRGKVHIWSPRSECRCAKNTCRCYVPMEPQVFSISRSDFSENF